MVLITPPRSSSPGTIGSYLAPWSVEITPGIILSVTIAPQRVGPRSLYILTTSPS